jgi:hypothetical protein
MITAEGFPKQAQQPATAWADCAGEVSGRSTERADEWRNDGVENSRVMRPARKMPRRSEPSPGPHLSLPVYCHSRCRPLRLVGHFKLPLSQVGV